MPNVAPKTVIKLGTCACCDGRVHILTNKNGIAYYFCNGSDPVDPVASCSHHQKWGKAASQRMQRDFLELKAQAANLNRAPKGVAANKNEAPKNERSDTGLPESGSGKTAKPKPASGGGSFLDY